MKRKSKLRKPRKTSVEDLENQLTRALADYDNLRKRVEREREDFGKLARATLMARLLPVYDMLEGAQAHLKDSGMAIMIEEFAKVLKEEGIEKIEVKQGDKFNEELHEAVEVADLPAGKKGKGKNGGGISEIILSGWKLADGPVIRPVKVKVYRK